jgi:ribosomal protein S18 acetylase RimI-like enzyme
VLVADTSDSRVLLWQAFATVSFAPADVVIGQASRTELVSDISANTLGVVHGIASDGNQIAIADCGASRVLVYDPFPTVNGAAASRVPGQSHSFAGTPNDDDQNGVADATPSARTLARPHGTATPTAWCKMGGMAGDHLHDAPVARLGADMADACVAVLGEAFAEDPTLRFVIGEAGGAFRARLRSLVGFFVSARLLRGEPILGIRDGSDLVGAALVAYPWLESPRSVGERRSAVWDEVGPEARARYEAMGRAAARFEPRRPHVHLNMLGVLRPHRGAGLGRRLVDATQELSRGLAASEGVALVTEGAANVSYYRRLGFEELGRAAFAPGLEVCVFFRGDEVAP